MANKIVGDIAGVPNPKSDFAQTDERKANYIKNKPDMNLYGNALKGSASGTEIHIDDVSPVVHKVKCTTDASVNSVTVKSANLFDVFNETYEKVNNRAKEEVTEDGTLKIISIYEMPQVAHRAVIPMERFEVGEVFISTLIKCEIEGATPGIYISFYNSTDGTSKGSTSKFITAPKTPVEYSLKFTITDEIKSLYDTVRIVFYISQNAETKVPVGGCSEFAKCMVSHNEDAKYEPYTSKTYEVENGTVEIESLYPSMNISSDVPNAVLKAEYNKDINKAFNDLLQLIISLGGVL